MFRTIRLLIIGITPCLMLTAMSMVCLAQTANGEEIPITCSKEALAEFLKGRDAFEMERMNDARTLFDKAIQKDPKFVFAYLYRAYSANSPAQWRKNMDLAVANKDHVSDGEQILVNMHLTYLNNDAERRFELASELVEKYPASPRTLLVLAEEYHGRKENIKARDLIYEAIKINPEIPIAYRDLGSSYLFNEPKELTLAEKYMKKFVELRPKEASVHIWLGDVYRAQLKSEKSRDAYSKAAELDPQSHMAFGKKATVNTLLGNYDEARADFRKAQEVAKDSWKVTWANDATSTHLYEGNVELALKANEEIIKNIEKIGLPADQINNAKAQTYFNRAFITMNNGMFDMAEEALDKYNVLLKQIADDVGSLEWSRSLAAQGKLWEGVLAVYKGDTETAIAKADEHAKLLEPEKNPRKLEQYHWLMGKINHLRGDYEQAVAHYQKSNLDFDVTVNYDLALAHEANQNMEEAERSFKKVADWNFNSVQYALIRNKAIEKVRRLTQK